MELSGGSCLRRGHQDGPAVQVKNVPVATDGWLDRVGIGDSVGEAVVLIIEAGLQKADAAKGRNPQIVGILFLSKWQV